MGKWARPLGTLAGTACLLVIPLAAQLAFATNRGTSWAGWLVAAQAGLMCWMVTALAMPGGVSAWRTALRGLISLGLSAVTLLAWRQSDSGLVLAATVPHAIAYSGLLTLFARSLARGREPIISRVARHARGALSPELQRYTRRVTIAWCGFFAAQLAVSLLLALTAPLAWWSAFVNLCNFPLLVTMFGAELGYRHWRHGIHRPVASVGRAGRILQVMGQIGLAARPAKP